MRGRLRLCQVTGDPCNRRGTERFHQGRVGRIERHRLMENIGIVRLRVRGQLAEIIRASTLRIVLHGWADAELRKNAAEISRAAESTKKRLHQAAPLLRIHLRSGIGNALLYLAATKTSQRWPDDRGKLVLRDTTVDLVVVFASLLVAEVSAHCIAEDATELIEERHRLLVVWGLDESSGIAKGATAG